MGSKGESIKLGKIVDVCVSHLSVAKDNRGIFFKAYSQDPESFLPKHFETREHFFTVSKKHVFRGMHFQGLPHEAAKIITIVRGSAIDFLYDLRKNSPSYGTLQIQPLSELDPVSIFIPAGVAHGYLSLEEATVLSYRQDVSFCKSCDNGFNGLVLQDFLPIDINQTIRSDRDVNLADVWSTKYLSRCSN
jgi:dTDP-4-dehydrorhamnose 3,5-epimerase